MEHPWMRWCCALVALISLTCGVSHATTVAVAPSDTSVTVGDTVVVRIDVSAFPDLKGCELIYAFTSSKLKFVGASAGDVIAGTGGGYFDRVLPDYAAPADSVWYDAALLSGSSAGPGVIASFAFRAIANGDAFLTCEHVDLRDSSNQQTLPPCAGGVIHILPPVATRSTSWGRLKVTYH